MSDVDYKESDVKYLESIIANPDPVFTAPELADDLDVTQQAAYDRLADMRERGLVKSKKVGSRAVVWWITTGGIDAYKDSAE